MRSINPFFLIVTLVISLAYAYAVHSLALAWAASLALALPFLSIWAIPVLYWTGRREAKTNLDHALQIFSYISMGWLSFLFVSLLLRDLVLIMSQWFAWTEAQVFLSSHGADLVLGFSFASLAWGVLSATRGPTVKKVALPFEQLPESLEGLRIVQISDLHVGPTIRRGYVAQVVRKTLELAPDIVVLTGDLVDGSVADLKEHIAPLTQLGPPGAVYLILGNHDYYSGSVPWTQEFRALGMKVLLNEHSIYTKGHASLMIAGVLDPAARMLGPQFKPDPERALLTKGDESGGAEPSLKILLAHNPQLAKAGAAAGFDLQLSGHTHAGQFIPWTLITRWIHSPHYAGLSREGKMWVYVSAGTGSWGPPIRMGTKTELTLLTLTRSQ